MDEPLSNLDAKLRVTMRAELARLHERLGVTTVYVTHDQIEAMTLGQRIVVFRNGEIQQIDTPMNLYTKPRNIFVAGFLGSPAMNFFRGTLRRDGNRCRLECAGLELPLGDGLPWLAAHEGRQLVAGARPEDLRPVSDAGAATASLSAQLDVVEPVGNEVFLNLTCAGVPIVVRMPPTVLPAPGSTLTLGYAPGALHFFDAGTTLRIAAS